MSTEPDISGTELIQGKALTALVRKPQPAQGPHPVLVMIHGWGAKESDIYELVPFVDKRVLIVAPRGPSLASDDPRGSFKWYERTEPGHPDEASIGYSTEKLGALLDELGELGQVEIDPSQIYIGGFSQGGVMALQMAATYPERLAGVISHSGFMSPSAAERLRAGVFKGKSAFVAHGTLDIVLRPNFSQQIKEILKEGGVDVTFHEYPIGHATSIESRQDLGNWLNPRLRF
ncbi:MAG TPA: alpha/beta fold hydrolase [Chloroflexia bacterium]|nr:alpha/beta fold hydrolase [Chloroflexia bacterium]